MSSVQHLWSYLDISLRSVKFCLFSDTASVYRYTAFTWVCEWKNTDSIQVRYLKKMAVHKEWKTCVWQFLEGLELVCLGTHRLYFSCIFLMFGVQGLSCYGSVFLVLYGVLSFINATEKCQLVNDKTLLRLAFLDTWIVKNSHCHTVPSTSFVKISKKGLENNHFCFGWK